MEYASAFGADAPGSINAVLAASVAGIAVANGAMPAVTSTGGILKTTNNGTTVAPLFSAIAVLALALGCAAPLLQALRARGQVAAEGVLMRSFGASTRAQ